MDLQTLRSLPDGLLAGSGALTSVAIWCRDWCAATGDGRYCILGEALGALDEWWSEHNERGGVPTALLAELQAVLASRLADVLDAPLPADGASLAALLRDEVCALLLPASAWVANGYAE